LDAKVLTSKIQECTAAFFHAVEQEWNEAGGLVWFAGYDILLCMPSASKSIVVLPHLEVHTNLELHTRKDHGASSVGGNSKHLEIK